MADTFRIMAEQCAPLGVAVLIEPLSKNETDSVVGCSEGMDLVRACGHPNFKLHVDLKSTFDQKEDQDHIWGAFGRFIRHCHVADPGLEPPSSKCSGHAAASAAMKKYNYSGYVSIEMKRCNNPAVVETAVNFVKDVYGALGVSQWPLPKR